MFDEKVKTRKLSERSRRIYDFIDANHTGVLASVDPNGNPHAAVIYHVISKKDFSVCFLTKTGTKKFDNLIRDDHVVLVVFDPVSQTVAHVTGKAEQLTVTDDIDEVATEIFRATTKAGQSGIAPIQKLNAGDYAAFKIQPAQIRMASFSSPGTGDYSQLFESVESFELNPTL